MKIPDKVKVLAAGGTCVLTAGLTLAYLIGTSNPGKKSFIHQKKTDRYAISFEPNVDGNKMSIRIANEWNPESYVLKVDRDGDGRFEATYLNNVPKGSRLEEYANYGCERIYSFIIG